MFLLSSVVYVVSRSANIYIDPVFPHEVEDLLPCRDETQTPI